MLRKHNDNRLLFRRRELRQKQTDTEKILWECVRNNALGHKIRRQCGIGTYIVDFLCIEKKLVIEIDGPYHEIIDEEDVEKSNYLTSFGYNVLRFTTEQITNGLPSVLAMIKQCLDDPSPS